MTIFNVIKPRRGRRYANGVQESPRSCGAIERINVDGEPISYGIMIGPREPDCSVASSTTFNAVDFGMARRQFENEVA